jgi:hypothetical protein
VSAPSASGAGPAAPIVTIDALDPATMALWRTVARIAQALDDQDVRWCLVGGLMVALFAIEAGQISRPTADIDILGDARQRPSATESITRQLTELGATRHEIGGFESEKGFREVQRSNRASVACAALRNQDRVEHRARRSPARSAHTAAALRREESDRFSTIWPSVSTPLTRPVRRRGRCTTSTTPTTARARAERSHPDGQALEPAR